MEHGKLHFDPNAFACCFQCVLNNWVNPVDWLQHSRNWIIGTELRWVAVINSLQATFDFPVSLNGKLCGLGLKSLILRVELLNNVAWWDPWVLNVNYWRRANSSMYESVRSIWKSVRRKRPEVKVHYGHEKYPVMLSMQQFSSLNSEERCSQVGFSNGVRASTLLHYEVNRNCSVSRLLVYCPIYNLSNIHFTL